MKDTFVTLGVKAVMTNLISKVSWIAWPFINPVTELFVRYVVTQVATAGETAAFFMFIDMRVGKQSDAFEAAALRNYNAQRTGTAQEKLDAEANLKRTFAEFVSLTN